MMRLVVRGDISAMPLIAWSALGYAGGLLAGLCLAERDARSLWRACSRRSRSSHYAAERRWVGAVAVVAAGAIFVARDLRRGASDRAPQCLGSLHAWELRVDVPVNAGGIGHGELSAGGCQRRATVIVETGHGEPGEVLRATGEAQADASTDARSMLVTRAEPRARARSNSPLRLRAGAGARIDALFGVDAPVVRALVIADMSAIPAAQRDMYANAGLVHMLSVSGLHVGIIAFALELLGAALRLPRAPVRVGTLALLTVYVVAIGAPPPAVRAAVMLGALLASRMRQRPTSAWAVLALGALAPLATPRIVLDLGWQLSVAGTAALIARWLAGRRVIPVAGAARDARSRRAP